MADCELVPNCETEVKLDLADCELVPKCETEGKLEANSLFLQVIYNAWEYYHSHQYELWLDRF